MNYRGKRINALKYLIGKTKDATDFAKRLAFLLIDESKDLTQAVCITITEGDEYTEQEVREIAGSFSKMESSNCSTHLHALTVLCGKDFVFSFHYGNWDEAKNCLDNSGQFAGASPNQVQSLEVLLEGKALRFTFWLSRKSYGHDQGKILFLKTSRKDLEQVELASGLYETSKERKERKERESKKAMANV